VRIDAIYNPVRRANFTVAETRVGQRTDYDRLTLTVETNGTISPQEAVSTRPRWRRRTSSTSWASARRRRFPGAADAAPTATPSAGRAVPHPDRRLELSVRSVNSLKNSNIRSLGDLVRQTEAQILQVKNFGKKSLKEIADCSERKGLNFGMRYEESPSDGVRILDMGTPPSRAAENAPDDDEEDED
jgi:DNA-directed RNA polymerase subunit alpha